MIMALGKRKKSDNKDSETTEVTISPSKKSKADYSESVKRLEQNESLTVKNFLKRCESDGHVKVVLEYFETGNTAQDLVNLLQENKNITFIPVLTALHFVVITVVRDAQVHKPDTEEACKYLLDHFLPEMQDMLSNKSTAKNKKVVLKLFSSMVTLSVSLARTILVHIKFNPHILAVLTKHTQPSEASVRTCFIHFLMSFFIDKNSLLINSLLQKKGVTASIISGLMYDDACTVNLVLTTLYENVIMNTAVTKTLKLHTFSTPIIQSLLKLYSWKGPEKLKLKDDNEVETEADDEKKAVVEVLHNFLIALCTSHKHGVAFHDKYVGTSGKKCNELLQGVVESMEKPWENEYLSQLTLKILSSCPDLVKKVLLMLEPYLEPRVSLQWMKALEFAKHIIQSVDPEVSLKPYAHGLKMQHIIGVVHALAVPSNLLHIINDKMLEHEHLLIRHEGTKLLSIMLEKFLSYSNVLKSWKVIDESVLQSLCIELMKQMTNPEVVLSLWKRALSCKDRDENELTDIPSLSLHLSSIVDLWLKYSQCFPSLLNTVNSLDLLKSVQDVDESDVTDLQLQLLRFIMTVDSSALIPEKDIFKTALMQLSKFTNHPSQEVILHSRRIFTELLISSGVFEGAESEVNIWAHCCFKVPHKHVELIMQLLHKSMRNINKNPNLYVNAVIQSEESVENDIIKDNNKLEQMLEDLLETRHSENEFQSHDTVVKLPYQVTLSLLLPAVLKTASSCIEYKSNASVGNFLSSVVIHLIHSQPSPEILWNLVQQFCDLLPLFVSRYIDGWLNIHTVLSPDEIFGKHSLETKFSKALINGEGSLFAVLQLECKDNDTEGDIVPIVLRNHKVFVSKASISTTDPVHFVLLYKLAIFHLTQLARQEAMKDSSKDQCQDSLVILLAILQYLDKKQKSHHADECLKFTFTHSLLLSLFVPLHKRKTKMMIIEIIQELISSVPLPTSDHQLLVPFKQKIVYRIIKFVKKCQKTKINEETNLPALSLYGLTSSDTVQVMNHLVQVPTDSLYYSKGEVYHLSVLGKIFAELLNLCVSIRKPLSSHHLVGVAEHLGKMKKVQIADIGLLENSLFRYLEKFKHNLEDIPGGLFYSLLLHQEINTSSVHLASLLLTHKANLKEFFVSLVKKKRNFRSKSNILFPLLSVLIKASNNVLEQNVLEKVYTHYCNDIRQGILAPVKSAAWLKDYAHVAVLLINKCMDLDTCVALCKQMNLGIELEKSEDFCQEITIAFLCKLNRKAPEEFKPNVVLLIVMQLVNDLWKRKLSDKKQLEDISLFVKACTSNSSNDGVGKWGDLRNTNVWMKFISMTLKYGIQTQKEVLDTEGYLLRSLTKLCNLVYKTGEKDNEVLSIFQMTLSHSEFLSVALGDATKKKYHLMKLLMVLVEKNPLIVSSSQIPIMLGSYNATLGETDQLLLKLLKMYEAAGANFYNYKPYLWGEAAVNHYSVKSKARFSLLRQPKPSQVLDMLELERVQETVKRFPINRCLDDLQSTNVIDGEIYDIAFLLPLFSHLLSPEQFVQTHKFISCGGLALTISALASLSEMTRKVAYHVLSRFYFHEEASRNVKRRMLCMQFLNALRLGIANLNIKDNVPQLSCIVTTFLARASLIISQANHPLYNHIQNFVVAKPSLNLQVVPEFLTYFHSADVEYKLYRQWILEVLRDGFKSELDIKVCLKSAVFKLLHNFYFSILADVGVKSLILEVVNSAVKVPKAASFLVTNSGLISQLFHVIRQFPEDNRGNTAIINVLHDLSTSLSSQVLDGKKGGITDWSRQIMVLLLSVLIVKPNITESQLKTYLSTFFVVLLHSSNKALYCLLSLEKMDNLLEFAKNVLGSVPECEDMLKFGCKYVVINDKDLLSSSFSDNKNSLYYLRKIIELRFHKIHNYKAPKVRI